MTLPADGEQRNEKDYRDRTKISFGQIEAYAKDHLRVASISGTDIRLSLGHVRSGSRSPSPLLRMRDGDPMELTTLGSVLPSIAAATWKFSETHAGAGAQLATVTDGIQVTLSANHALGSDTTISEARLRGAVARLVVALRFG